MSCKECETANDIHVDYRFCKMCGHPRDVLNCSDEFLEKKGTKWYTQLTKELKHWIAY